MKTWDKHKAEMLEDDAVETRTIVSACLTLFALLMLSVGINHYF